MILRLRLCIDQSPLLPRNSQYTLINIEREREDLRRGKVAPESEVPIGVRNRDIVQLIGGANRPPRVLSLVQTQSYATGGTGAHSKRVGFRVGPSNWAEIPTVTTKRGQGTEIGTGNEKRHLF